MALTRPTLAARARSECPRPMASDIARAQARAEPAAARNHGKRRNQRRSAARTRSRAGGRTARARRPESLAAAVRSPAPAKPPEVLRYRDGGDRRTLRAWR